ncbi:MAG: hypothetical protein JW944_06140 [Deltaproteobacteria bacterium]|nr:hypothetical protein [Deltaproteobacteria bacterium]
MFKYIFSILVLLVMGCHGPVQEELVLFDFESDNELDRFHWKCRTLLSLSEDHATHGNRSLMLELYPSGYPGMSPLLKDKDWRAYESLNLDIYNPEEKEMKIVVRIDDRGDAPDYDDRYNHSFVLMPGSNRINIPLNTLVTSGTKRNLDLKDIQALVIFMVNPLEKHRVFIDYVRLQG